MSRRVQQFITAPQGNPRKPICNPSRFASWLNCICFKRFSCARSNESWTWGFGKFLELPKVVHLNWQTYRRIGQEENKLYWITLPLCGLSNILLTNVKPKRCAPGWRHPSQMHQDFLCICAVWETKVLDNSTQSMEMKLKEVILSRVVEGRDVIEFDHANSDNPSDWSPMTVDGTLVSYAGLPFFFFASRCSAYLGHTPAALMLHRLSRSSMLKISKSEREAKLHNSSFYMFLQAQSAEFDMPIKDLGREPESYFYQGQQKSLSNSRI